MKNVLPYLILLLISCFSISTYAQSNDEPEALGLPGDNLNLYAVLDVFQKSKTLEDFEKAINDEEGKILGQIVNPIEKVGIYVPGGTAPLPSTVLMNAIPATPIIIPRNF